MHASPGHKEMREMMGLRCHAIIPPGDGFISMPVVEKVEEDVALEGREKDLAMVKRDVLGRRMRLA